VNFFFACFYAKRSYLSCFTKVCLLLHTASTGWLERSHGIKLFSSQIFIIRKYISVTSLWISYTIIFKLMTFCIYISPISLKILIFIHTSSTAELLHNENTIIFVSDSSHMHTNIVIVTYYQMHIWWTLAILTPVMIKFQLVNFCLVLAVAELPPCSSCQDAGSSNQIFRIHEKLLLIRTSHWLIAPSSISLDVRRDHYLTREQSSAIMKQMFHLLLHKLCHNTPLTAKTQDWPVSWCKTKCLWVQRPKISSYDSVQFLVWPNQDR